MVTRTVTVTRTYSNGAVHTRTKSFDVADSRVPPPVLLPGQVAGKVICGLCTDNYATRVAELGRTPGADHFFVGPDWDENEFVAKAGDAHSRGCLPYGNMKVGPLTWGQMATSQGDARVAALASRIAALGYPVRVALHHEPGNNTPTGSGDNGTGVEWRDMLIRQLPRIKAIAPNAIVGPVDNGFKWSANSQGWTDAQLAQIYTDALLSVCDVLGADYYDGATTRTNGEPAVVKVQRADAWASRIGWDKPMDIGEWNFVRPADCDSMTAFLTAHADRWWCANAFDSDTGNRSGIPTIGAKWGFDHGYDTTWDRRDAARRMFDNPLVYP